MDASKTQDISFLISSLHEILKKIEKNQLNLDLFFSFCEEFYSILKKVRKILAKTEKNITILKKTNLKALELDDDGIPIEVPFIYSTLN